MNTNHLTVPLGYTYLTWLVHDYFFPSNDAYFLHLERKTTCTLLTSPTDAFWRGGHRPPDSSTAYIDVLDAFTGKAENPQKDY